MAPKHFIDYSGHVPQVPNVPSKIKCSRCDIVKVASAFANKRLAELSTKIAQHPRFNPVVQGFVPCTSCTGGQRIEHTCSMCDKSKATDTGFSKAQLKRGEDAICIKCSSERSAMGPGGGAAHEQSESEDGSNEDSDDGDSECSASDFGSTLVSGGDSAAANRSIATAGTFPSRWGMSSRITASKSTPGGVSLGSAPTRPTSLSSASAGFSGGYPPKFNPKAYGQAAEATPSLTASTAGASRQRASKFAKVRAPKNQAVRVPQDDSEEEDEDDEIIHSDSDWEEKHSLSMGI